MTLANNENKTEPATPEKLRKAQKEGLVPKSHDFVSALTFCFGLLTLSVLGPHILYALRSFIRQTIVIALSAPLDKQPAITLNQAQLVTIQTVLPIGLCVMLIGVCSHLIQTGLFFSPIVLKPKIERLDPVQGFKNLFKTKKLIELLRDLTKAIAVVCLAGHITLFAAQDIPRLIHLDLPKSLYFSYMLISKYLGYSSVLFLLVGLMDLLWSRYQFLKEQQMSKYEVKQEYKQQEGDPYIKNQRKQRAQELILESELASVKHADAVVLNPTHIAVAIKYKQSVDHAPRVVAKGQQLQAKRLRDLAAALGIPTVQNIALARALHRLSIDEEVPCELYDAVAEVLSFVYRLRQAHAFPPLPSIDSVQGLPARHSVRSHPTQTRLKGANRLRKLAKS